MAACLPSRSIRYSSTKRRWRGDMRTPGAWRAATRTGAAGAPACDGRGRCDGLTAFGRMQAGDFAQERSRDPADIAGLGPDLDRPADQRMRQPKLAGVRHRLDLAADLGRDPDGLGTVEVVRNKAAHEKLLFLLRLSPVQAVVIHGRSPAHLKNALTLTRGKSRDCRRSGGGDESIRHRPPTKRNARVSSRAPPRRNSGAEQKPGRSRRPPGTLPRMGL